MPAVTCPAATRTQSGVVAFVHPHDVLLVECAGGLLAFPGEDVRGDYAGLTVGRGVAEPPVPVRVGLPVPPPAFVGSCDALQEALLQLPVVDRQVPLDGFRYPFER